MLSALLKPKNDSQPVEGSTTYTQNDPHKFKKMALILNMSQNEFKKASLKLKMTKTSLSQRDLNSKSHTLSVVSATYTQDKQ